MRHNESLADRESDTVKPTKLSRIKDAAVTAGVIAIPLALTVGSVYAGLKVSKMQFETAKLNLETAKLNQS
jgi:hypothetical protein